MIGMRQIESDEARRIVDSDAVRPPGELLRIAEARHEGGRGGLGLEYGRDEEAPDRYLFSTDVEDADGIVWHLLLDAHSGDIVADVRTPEDNEDLPAEPAPQGP
ncbi:hypothetical protein OKJ48_25585 [Streptomyces kunmingensis]|uniref:PepSY domain-containing protein n=1 Tax=Streptomyces kunmingensis TaxID=68225 RepID=A0ABU6CHY8_9ACTN|nr:hypothetical protein [Streptomyces kunmingensis]MEB3963586.1 hypothetical protein [Streptomyces kunmingensis]